MRNEFLRLVGAPNESLILIIIYYMFKLSWDQNNFVRVASEQKNYFEGYISAKLVITIKFLREMNFLGFSELQMSP